MQCSCSPAGVWATRSARNATKFVGAGRVGDPAGDVAVVHVEAGEQHGGAVAAVLELAAHRRPRAPPGLVGLTRLVAWIPDFSSTDHTTALSGGFRYRPHTSAALAQNSGSWEVIHDSVCHGLRSKPRQIRHTCDAEIGTPCSLIRAAIASIVQRVAASGGGSVTVLTNNNTSSWPYTGGRPGPFTVVQADHPELAVAATPHRHLVVVHPDRLADRPGSTHRRRPSTPSAPAARHAPRPCSRPHPTLQLVTITRPEHQRR